MPFIEHERDIHNNEIWMKEGTTGKNSNKSISLYSDSNISERPSAKSRNLKDTKPYIWKKSL